MSTAAPDELPWDRPKPHPDDGDLFTMSDSTEVLTIGDETFPVVSREPIAEPCLTGEPHQLYLVAVEDGRKFEVCDECSSSKLLEAPPAEEPTE